jgi:hypothetical protein
MEAALRWLADHTPATAELLRLLDGTPVVCGRSRTTARRSNLAGWAGYGRDTSHHCFYWGSRLLLLTTPDGTVTGFGLANPKQLGERQAVVAMLGGVPANRPAPGTLLVGDKGFAGCDFQTALAELALGILRPARTDEPDVGVFPNWLRQRIEAIIWTLKHQLGLDRHGGRIPAGLWARVVQRLLALNAASGSTGRSAPRPSAPWSPTTTNTASTSIENRINDLGAAVRKSRSWVGAGCSVDRWHLVAEGRYAVGGGCSLPSSR